MGETGVTYRGLAEQTNLSAGYLNHLVHGNRPVPSNEVIETLARALGVEPEHFREHRLRVITQRLERMPELIDRLYRRLGCAPRRRQEGCGTIRMYGRGSSQPSGYVSLASSFDTEPAMMTRSPLCQFAGVATLCFAVSCIESITRSTSSKFRPVVIG